MSSCVAIIVLYHLSCCKHVTARFDAATNRTGPMTGNAYSRWGSKSSRGERHAQYLLYGHFLLEPPAFNAGIIISPFLIWESTPTALQRTAHSWYCGTAHVHYRTPHHPCCHISHLAKQSHTPPGWSGRLGTFGSPTLPAPVLEGSMFGSCPPLGATPSRTSG